MVAQAIGRSLNLSRPLRFALTYTARPHLTPRPAYRPCACRQPYSTSNLTQTPPSGDPHNAHEEAPPSPVEPPKSAPPKAKRSLRPYIFATVCFLVGAAAGQYIKLVIAPPPLPTPGTPEDESLTAYIHKLASKLPIVQSLSIDPSWISWDAYSNFTPAEKAHRITTGPLAGARGTGEFVSVLWLGGAVAGWPGVAHGGLIATVLDESLSRAAIARFPAKTGVTANLELTYLAPTVTNAFVIIRVYPALEGSTDTKGFVAGRMETLEGKVCVEAKGLFVVPKNIRQDRLKPIELKNLGGGF
jgi:acyl-coenzyme A thioesterase PaaI-like protein